MSMRPATDPVLVLTRSVPPRPLSVRPRHVVAALCVAAAVASILLFALSTGGSSPAKPKAATASTYTAPGGDFSLTYPAGWHATAAGAGAVAIQRGDKTALVTLRESAALKGSLSKLAQGLPSELRKRFPDFQPIGARAVQLSTGPALVYSFARTKSDKVQTMVIAPTAKHTFTLVAVAKPGAKQAAAEAGAIVRSLRAG
jgi:hypothetical protein